MADVVIAADGTHSTARSAVIGYDSMACFSGEATYRALVPTEAAFQNSVRRLIQLSEQYI